MLESQVTELHALGGTVSKDAAGQPTALLVTLLNSYRVTAFVSLGTHTH